MGEPPGKSPSPSLTRTAELNSNQLWEMIGFHRPLGGWMYNYILGIVKIFAGLLLVGV